MFFLSSWMILYLYQNQYYLQQNQKLVGQQLFSTCITKPTMAKPQEVLRWEPDARRDMEAFNETLTASKLFGFKISLARCSISKMEPDLLRCLKFREFACACLSDNKATEPSSYTYWECACFPEQKHQVLTLTRIVNVESFQRKKSWAVAPNKKRHERCKSQLGLK